MKTSQELEKVGQRIYWLSEYGQIAEVVQELQSVQNDALKEAAKIARHAGTYASDHPGCQRATDAIMQIVKLNKLKIYQKINNENLQN